jgi:hypothetical protein
MVPSVSVACSVLKGDKPAAGAGSLEDTPLNYGWAPFNGDNGQVRRAAALASMQ